MRIIAGKYKGSRIQTINESSTRPMMSKAREGIFNSLQNSFEGSLVLDLFAGSGSLGIESLSRNASFVTFVDSSIECKKVIMKNLSNLDNNYTFLLLKVSEYIQQSNQQFNIIFYDPPFSLSTNEVNNDLNSIKNLMKTSSKLVIHRHKSSDQFVYPDGLGLYREKKYGQSNITILEK